MFFMNDQLTNMFKNFQPGNEQFTNAVKNMFSGSIQNAAGSQNSFFGNEQFTNAVKATIEMQTTFLNTITASTLATVEKLVELNMSAAKITVEETGVITKQLLTSRDAQEVQALLGALPQSISSKATAYSRHLANIGSASQAEFTRAAEQQFASTGGKLSALIDQASKKMPTGFEYSGATAKAVIASASAGYEQFNKNAQQADETVGAKASNAADKVS